MKRQISHQIALLVNKALTDSMWKYDFISYGFYLSASTEKITVMPFHLKHATHVVVLPLAPRRLVFVQIPLEKCQSQQGNQFQSTANLEQ